MTPQELKESILWNAIQGKITEQNPHETVNDVIESTQITSFTEEETYFEIPNNWKWVHIGDIFDLVNGKAFKPSDWSDKGIPIVRIQNLNDPSAPYNYCSASCEDKYYLHGGELLFSWSGTPGTSFGAFIWNGGEAVLNQHIFIVHPKIKADKFYLMYALNAELKIFVEKAHGGAGLKHITRKEFDACFLPIPPLAEQKRIVAKIEELLPLIDRYEKAWSRLEEFNNQFPGNLQKSILQMAIQGKLVEQRPEEGTGEELIAEIREHRKRLIKQKAIKNQPVQYNDSEEPFDIPKNWIWVKIGEIEEINLGFTYRPKYVKEGVYFLSVKDISNGIIDFTNAKKISRETYDNASYGSKPCRGDILFGRVGTMGKPQIIDTDIPFCIFVSLGFFRDHLNAVDKKYVSYWMQSRLFEQQVDKKVKGSAQKNLNTNWLKDFYFPLPPIAEQKRIVVRIEELLPLCEKLK